MADRETPIWRIEEQLYSEQIYGAFQWAGEHCDYDFIGGEFRFSDVAIGDEKNSVTTSTTIFVHDNITKFEV